jgi:hypothetical protein
VHIRSPAGGQGMNTGLASPYTCGAAFGAWCGQGDWVELV